MLERALDLEQRLSPGCISALGEAHHISGDYAGSLAVLDRIVDPPYYVRLFRAVNLARLGHVDEASRVVEEAPTGFDLERYARSTIRMCARQEDAELWRESFRLLGLRL